MKQTKEILTKLEESFSNIDYYHLIVEKIEENVSYSPDISIESCKSLIEGISKFIWRQMDASYNSARVDAMDLPDIFKKFVNHFSSRSELIEVDFVKRACSLILSISEIRNKRGDISHGRLSPKELVSDAEFSNLVMQMTDGLVYYLLSCFSRIRIQRELVYEDNAEFNHWLDEQKQFGGLSFSQALFAQDIEAYKQELLSYGDLIETEKEDA